METWHLVEREMGGGIEVEIRGDLYHASSSSLLDLIQELSDDEESVLLVGHNPTFESLAIFLAGSGESRALSELRHKYPTGALAILDFPTNRWEEVRAGTGHLRDFIKPRTLKS
jgi:phosphohistidine phosphatase